MSAIFHMVYLLVGLGLAAAIYHIHSCNSQIKHATPYTVLAGVVWCVFVWGMLEADHSILRQKCSWSRKAGYASLCHSAH